MDAQANDALEGDHERDDTTSPTAARTNAGPLPAPLYIGRFVAVLPGAGLAAALAYLVVSIANAIGGGIVSGIAWLFGARNCDALSLDDPLPTVTAGGTHLALAEPALIPLTGSLHTSGGVDRVVTVDGTRYVLDVRFRMLEPAELAAAQGFPPGYLFAGTRTEVTAQIGNAVPEKLAYALGCAALDALGFRAAKPAA
jgi:hypothetical protein